MHEWLQFQESFCFFFFFFSVILFDIVFLTTLIPHTSVFLHLFVYYLFWPALVIE